MIASKAPNIDTSIGKVPNGIFAVEGANELSDGMQLDQDAKGHGKPDAA